MTVIRVTGEDGTESFELRGMTRKQAEMLGALADFPLWSAQPKAVGEFCMDLYEAVDISVGAHVHAESVGMTPETSVVD